MNEMKWKETTLKKISYIMLKCIHIRLPFFSIINNKWDIQGIQVRWNTVYTIYYKISIFQA